MLNVAMLSMWHVHADGYAAFVNQQSDAKVTCIWDDDPVRGQAAAEKHRAAFVPDLAALLARPDVDAVIVDAPTSDHYAVIGQAAGAGKHIFTEKVLAPLTSECVSLKQAIEKSGVTFAISFPHLTSGALQYVKTFISDGKLGRVTNLRARNVHNGCEWLPERWYDMAKTCGGAMMDLGAHPNYIALYLLGKPARVTSVFNTVRCPEGVDDNTVSLVEFENKAIAIVESGFVTPVSPNTLEIEGTEGAIVVEGGRVRYHTRQSGVDGWVTPVRLPPPEAPVMRQWMDAILYGTPLPERYGIDAAVALTELMEAEYDAQRQSRTMVL